MNKTIRINDSYQLLIIFFLYILSNFFMFFSNGWFWDDWTLFTSEGIKEIFNGIGAPFLIPIHTFIMNLTSYPALLYHILTGILEIFGIWIFYKSLLLLGVSRSNTFLLSLIFALLPYNQAKITMSCFMYSIGFLFFLLAILFFIKFSHKNNIFIRLISLIFFICSYLFLPSTLVLAYAFLLLVAIINIDHEIQFQQSFIIKVLKKLLYWADFVLLPIFFWVFRLFFLMPTGIYAAEGYRGFTVSSILLAPINTVVAFIQNFIGIGTIANSISRSSIFPVLYIVIFVVVFIVLRKHKIEYFSKDKKYFYIGLFLFVAGVFAYVTVGLHPLFESYNSRHQILLKFGSAFLLFSLVSLSTSIKLKKILVTTILSLFIVYNISTHLQFQKSWFKQTALEKAFSKEVLLIEGTNFIIQDNTKIYNEFNGSEPYRFYNYTGILMKTYGTQNRFAINSKELDSFLKQNYNNYIGALYLTKDCTNLSSFKYLVIINQGNEYLSNIFNIKMLYQYYFNKLAFDKSLDDILSIQVLPYDIDLIN